MAAAMRWGRLQANVRCALRRGAWYRVAHVAGLKAVVDVNRELFAVPSYLLEIVTTPPRFWTVVDRPTRSPQGAATLGPRYAVCPSCRERTSLPLQARPRTLSCRRCRGHFEVDWNEAYLAS